MATQSYVSNSMNHDSTIGENVIENSFSQGSQPIINHASEARNVQNLGEYYTGYGGPHTQQGGQSTHPHETIRNDSPVPESFYVASAPPGCICFAAAPPGSNYFTPGPSGNCCTSATPGCSCFAPAPSGNNYSTPAPSGSSCFTPVLPVCGETGSETLSQPVYYLCPNTCCGYHNCGVPTCSMAVPNSGEVKKRNPIPLRKHAGDRRNLGNEEQGFLNKSRSQSLKHRDNAEHWSTNTAGKIQGPLCSMTYPRPEEVIQGPSVPYKHGSQYRTDQFENLLMCCCANYSPRCPEQSPAHKSQLVDEKRGKTSYKTSRRLNSPENDERQTEKQGMSTTGTQTEVSTSCFNRETAEKDEKPELQKLKTRDMSVDQSDTSLASNLELNGQGMSTTWIQTEVSSSSFSLHTAEKNENPEISKLRSSNAPTEKTSGVSQTVRSLASELNVMKTERSGMSTSEAQTKVTTSYFSLQSVEKNEKTGIQKRKIIDVPAKKTSRVSQKVPSLASNVHQIADGSVDRSVRHSITSERHQGIRRNSDSEGASPLKRSIPTKPVKQESSTSTIDLYAGHSQTFQTGRTYESQAGQDDSYLRSGRKTQSGKQSTPTEPEAVCYTAEDGETGGEVCLHPYSNAAYCWYDKTGNLCCPNLILSCHQSDVDELESDPHTMVLKQELEQQRQAMVSAQEVQDQRQLLLLQKAIMNQRRMFIKQQELQYKKQALMMDRALQRARRDFIDCVRHTKRRSRCGCSNKENKCGGTGVLEPVVGSRLSQSQTYDGTETVCCATDSSYTYKQNPRRKISF